MSARRTTFTDADREQLSRLGIGEDEAARQLALLASPPPHMTLERPCTPGDGILSLEPEARPALLEAHAEAAAASRLRMFVPASGAASRMFRDLITAREVPGELDPADVRRAAAAGNAAAGALAQFAESLPSFAFADALARVLRDRGLDPEHVAKQGPWRPLLDALLSREGLDAARAPKGLLPFHRHRGRVRTAFEEHLIEAAGVAGDRAGRARIHFTVSAEHREGFERELARIRSALEFGARATDVSFSEQSPATDTLAADPAGGPFRDAAGRLVLRPAGHGALLGNLQALSGDLVFIKNIDNIAVESRRTEGTTWARLLLGLAARRSAEAHRLVHRLRAGELTALPEAAAFVRDVLGAEAPAGTDHAEWLAARLDRPWRVAGMVPNTGEPGGGPFWVREADGQVSAQIVESAQVDMTSPAQSACFSRGTHFNPVFIACALRGASGGPHVLERFVDERAGIVTRKSHEGRELLALERPGLWNGAMARWNTVFVEVPLAVFSPVKTVFDLLRPEHQGG